MPTTIEPYERQPAAYQDYDPAAPEVARLLAEAITADEPALSVEHVGSTAVPGCRGKGVIDLMVLYPPGRLEDAKAALAGLGFQRQTSADPFPEDRPMRTGAVRHGGKLYRVHAHVIAADADEARELRAFRDRLRADAQFRAEYEACKRAILAGGTTDSLEYSYRKGEFFRAAGVRGFEPG